MRDHRGVESSGSHGASAPWDAAAEAFTAWRSGDATAVDDLIRVMTPVLWHVARAYRLGPEVAQDVVQSTWLTFVRSHDAIADERAVASWLIVSTRREAARVAGRSGRVLPVEDEALAARLPESDSAEQEAVLDDESSRLWQVVGTLDERCRRLLRVVAFQHRPDYTRLAADMGMPVGSIGPTRGRCLEKVRRALVAEGGWR